MRRMLLVLISLTVPCLATGAARADALAHITAKMGDSHVSSFLSHLVLPEANQKFDRTYVAYYPTPESHAANQRAVAAFAAEFKRRPDAASVARQLNGIITAHTNYVPGADQDLKYKAQRVFHHLLAEVQPGKGSQLRTDEDVRFFAFSLTTHDTSLVDRLRAARARGAHDRQTIDEYVSTGFSLPDLVEGLAGTRRALEELYPASR